MPMHLLDALKPHASKRGAAPSSSETKPKKSMHDYPPFKVDKTIKKKTIKRKAKEMIDDEASCSSSEDDMAKGLDNELSSEGENEDEVVHSIISAIADRQVKKGKGEIIKKLLPKNNAKASKESTPVSSEEEDSSENEEKGEGDEDRDEPGDENEAETETDVDGKEKKKRVRKDTKDTVTTFALESGVLMRIGEKSMEEGVRGITGLLKPQLKSDTLTTVNKQLHKLCMKAEEKLEEVVESEDENEDEEENDTKEKVIGAMQMRAALEKLGPYMRDAIQYADRVMKKIETNPELHKSLMIPMNEKHFDRNVTKVVSDIIHDTKFDDEKGPDGVYIDLSAMNGLSTESAQTLIKFLDTLKANDGREVARLSLEMGMEITDTIREQMKTATSMISKCIPQCYDGIKVTKGEKQPEGSVKKKAKVSAAKETTEKKPKAKGDAPKKVKQQMKAKKRLDFDKKEKEPEKPQDSEPNEEPAQKDEPEDMEKSKESTENESDASQISTEARVSDDN